MAGYTSLVIVLCAFSFCAVHALSSNNFSYPDPGVHETMLQNGRLERYKKLLLSISDGSHESSQGLVNGDRQNHSLRNETLPKEHIINEDLSSNTVRDINKEYVDTASAIELFNISMEEWKRDYSNKRNETLFGKRSRSFPNKDSLLLSAQGINSALQGITSFPEEKMRSSRQKRSFQSSICQRRSMWVTFEDLGWSDWVIAPRAFQAYRCSGTCPYPLSGRLNGTNHAMMMSMMNSVDPEASPQPCCVPTKFSSVSMLYLDNSDNVVLQKYDDMIIESCGCR